MVWPTGNLQSDNKPRGPQKQTSRRPDQEP